MTAVFALDPVGRVLARGIADLVPSGAAECVVGAGAREDCEAFLAVAEACEKAAIPFFVVVLGPAALRVSAVYGRDYGSCYHCRAEAARAARDRYEHTTPVPAGYLPQHLRLAALAAADVIARLPDRDPLLREHRVLDLFDSTLSSTVSEDVHA